MLTYLALGFDPNIRSRLHDTWCVRTGTRTYRGLERTLFTLNWARTTTVRATYVEGVCELECVR